MTLQTLNLINNYHMTKDTSLIPGIFIGMQEEDNIANCAPFGGCMRMLRNISAHEPYTLVKYMNDITNRNYTTYAIVTNQETCNLCVYQLLTILFFMYAHTDSYEYITFASDMARLLVPARFTHGVSFSLPDRIDYTPSTLLHYFELMQHASCIQNGRIREYNAQNTRLIDMYHSNPKLFWKIVIPDITDFLLSGIPPESTRYHVIAYKFLVNIVMLRDTNAATAVFQ